MFIDRHDAGRQLATRLQHHRGRDSVVLALPRGGVPVAYEVAASLGAPLDIIVVRKLGAPGQPELGIGAVVDGDRPEGVLNEEVVEALGVSEDYLRREVGHQLAEIRRRETAYRHGRARVSVTGKTAIVIDDGLATGGSIRAAVRGLRRANPARIVVAVPVAPPEVVEQLAAEVEEVVYVLTPPEFGAVGRFYRDFEQTTDEEVTRLLDAARAGVPAAAAHPA